MLTTVAFVPTTPLLVPQLAGDARSETAPLRAAVSAAVAELGDRWSALGADTDDGWCGPESAGSFRGFGADVGVRLAPGTGGAPDPALPLAALVAGWLRGACAPQTSVRTELVARDASADRCAQLATTLRARWADDPVPSGLLVLGDGCTTLTSAAPGSFDARAPRLQDDLDAALGAADTAALAGLDPALCTELGVGARVAWQVAAAAVGAGWHGRLRHRSAPYGVGYTVAVWRR